ncbi:MAG: extracellular solute-binding protein [Oscillospiraceae bacterium]|nr:extracellular solute-binding protein [Oscillospiraceae bacterium]
MKFAYTPANGQERMAEINFDVVSPKLDTKNDLKIIIQQIRAEYDDIVFRYLTLTYQQFAEGREANNDIIWLAVFKNIIEGYINSVRYIIHRPHFRNHHYVDYLKAERIKKWSPVLSERFANDWCEDKERALNNLYRVERQETTEDTRENRFVKYTLERMGERLKVVLKKIKANSGDQVSDDENQGLDIYIRQLEKLRRAPLFKNIGRFDGFRQESIVMQQRTGYSQVYRYWLMLQNGLNYYNPQQTKTNFDDIRAVKSFEKWTDFYKKYSFEQSYDAFSRFRTGEYPIVIADYQFYNQLSTASPEIKGLWDFTQIPVTMLENGEISHAVNSTSSGAVIFNQCENSENAWEFLKWFTSAEVQASYAAQTEGLLGQMGRYPTANTEALLQSSWSKSELQALFKAREELQEIPVIPASYAVTRNIMNAFRETVNQNENPRDTLLWYNRDINNEITRKRQNLGISPVSDPS